MVPYPGLRHFQAHRLGVFGRRIAPSLSGDPARRGECGQRVHRFGAVLAGIRENEAKTVALGYNTRAYKIATVVLAYGFGGLAGALYAGFAGYASPELFFWLTSGHVLIMVVVGGSGTLVGPILGAVFFIFLEHELSQVTELWPLIFGSVFMAFVLLAPQGIWGLIRRHAAA